MSFQQPWGEIAEGQKPGTTRFSEPEPASGSGGQQGPAKRGTPPSPEEVADAQARARTERKAELAEDLDARVRRSLANMDQERLAVEKRVADKRRVQEERAAAERRGQWSHVAESDTAEAEAETKQQQSEADTQMRSGLDPESKQEKPTQTGIDPALADPWDLSPEERAARETPEGFEKFRQYNGHEITPSDSLLTNTRFEVEDVHAAANDVGIAARRYGISKEGAQAFFDVVGQGYQPPRGEAFDEDTAMRQMYAACGENTDAVLADLKAWVAKRPAVFALLDEGVLLGNHPGVLLTIGAVAQAAKGGLDITKPADAKTYVEKVMSDRKSEYWTGGGLHKLLVQGVQYAMAVAEAKR